MILYLVVNVTDHSCTAPAIAFNEQEIQKALDTINPENKSDLKIHILAELKNFYDLFLLTIDETKPLPDFLFNRSAEVTPSATPQATARESSFIPETYDYEI